MNPDRWKKIVELFVAASERNTSERQAFLADVCGSDSALREEVESLLSHDARAEGFLKPPSVDPVQRWGLDASAELLIGRRVGSYQLVKQLASGGMGSVWLAERADAQFNKRAAVKLIKRGMDTDRILNRFHVERQVLAGLEHPHIARMLDGGATDDGLPYMVMEYVDGSPIDRYCDERKLAIRARLELFRKVCEAVQYAHQNLVVHRDLKPGNILVTADGAVKLLDFGIAKVLAGGDVGSSVSLTLDGSGPMTPQYASPEQIRGESISTVTDVYSLGVVLYQLLTGQLPHGPTGHSLREMERTICEQEPRRPSDAVCGPEGVRIAADRSADVKRLRRILSGDLDTIVLMAMRKEPPRRYASVEALSEDIRRHLSGLPISARRDLFSYRTAKFVRRNVLGVSLTAVMFAFVVGFGMWMSVLYSRAEKEQQQTQRVAEFQGKILSEIDVEAMGRGLLRHLREQVKAGLDREQLGGAPNRHQRTPNEIDAALADFDRAAAPAHPVEVARRVMDEFILHRAATLLENEYSDQPLVEAAIRGAIGRCYQSLGLYSSATPYLLKAVESRRRILGDTHLLTAESESDLGMLYLQQSRYAESEPLLRNALNIRRRQLGGGDALVLVSINNMGRALMNLGKYAEAEAMALDALQLASQLGRIDHADSAQSWHIVGFSRMARADYAGAELAYRKALEMRRRLFGNNHPIVAGSLNNLATVYDAAGHCEKSEPLYREALAIAQKSLGPGHPQVALYLNNVGNALVCQGEYAAAREFLDDALALSQNRLGPDHYYVALSLGNLARLAEAQGDEAGAEPLYRRCLSVALKSYPDHHCQIAERKIALGACLTKLRRFDDAQPYLIQGYETLKAQLGERNPRVMDAVPSLVEFYSACGQAQKAAQWRAKLAQWRATTRPAASQAVSRRAA